MITSSPQAEEAERETMRLKIYADSLMRDLIVMEDTLTRAQAIHSSMKPDVLSPIPTMWTVGCTISAIAVPVRALVGVSIAGAIAGAVSLAAPTVWHSAQSKSLERNASKLRELKSAIENGADLTMYADYLSHKHFGTLKSIAAEIKASRERISDDSS
ncbi:hypothetical protein B0T14DRAFT_496208 [Immersiella caudata]|uniref:Uncharacterized protein n=1 Tax=Immersiella caudata TaxID=314043 RepID=A0AA39WQ67_9PEZI|nr:hypothetical protein B0T14DRAFT_496208 [Immersiella caudata]